MWKANRAEEGGNDKMQNLWVGEWKKKNKITQFMCKFIPYLNFDLWGIGKGLYKEGYKETPLSYKIAWGIGHPSYRVDFDEERHEVKMITCTRCGKDKLWD